MYGTALGTSVTAGSIAALPATSGSKMYLAITLATLTAGLAIIAVTGARALASKIFGA